MVLPTEKRIDALDALRGFAVLGILVMNIQIFAMPMAAYLNPTAYGSLDGIHGAVWALSHLLTDQKMMALFSMLFGAGMVLFCERAAASGKSEAGYHYRRNGWLMIFGLMHGYLLWHGDILFLYALCAFLLFPLRNKSARTLFKLGIIFLAVSSVLYLLSGVGVQVMPQEELDAQLMPMWQPALAELIESGDVERRRQLFKDLKSIYGLRSRIVHGGAADHTEVNDVCTKAIEVAITALKISYKKGNGWLSMKSSERSDSILLQI